MVGCQDPEAHVCHAARGFLGRKQAVPFQHLESAEADVGWFLGERSFPVSLTGSPPPSPGHTLPVAVAGCGLGAVSAAPAMTICCRLYH